MMQQRVDIPESQSREENAHVPKVGSHALEVHTAELFTSTEQYESTHKLGTASSKNAHTSRRRFWLIATSLSLFGAASISAKCTLSEGAWYIYVMISGITAFVPVIVFLDRYSRKERANRNLLVERVTNPFEARSLGDLVDALQFGYNLGVGDKEIWHVVVSTLTHMLPRLSATEAAALTPQQRTRLFLVICQPVESILRKDLRGLKLPADDQDIKLRIAILKVFEHIGDDRALPVVKRLATTEVRTSGEFQIRTAAIACLEVMEPRLALERNNASLLRASSVADATPNTLLRSASERPDQAPAELLWASETGEEIPSARFIT